MCDKRPYWHEAMTEGAFKKLLRHVQGWWELEA